MTYHRRQFLKAAAAGAGLAALSTPLRAIECGPPVVADHKGLLIDVHCHIFNADDLPVRGFANHVFWHTTGRGELNVGNWFSQALDWLGQLSAPGIRTETRLLEAILAENEAMHERYCRVERPHGGILASATNFRLHNALAMMTLYPETDLFVPAMVDLDEHLRDHSPVTLRQQIDLMEYIFVITGGRFHGYVSFDPLRQARYDTSKRNSRESPLSPLNMVKRAVLEQGFIGVKLYPPMGFRPFRNPELLGCYQGVDNDHIKLYDEILDELFDWCACREVPVITHCNDSNFADVHHSKGSHCNQLGTPGQWAAFFEKNWHYRGKLKVDLGHFGRADLHTRTRLKLEEARKLDSPLVKSLADKHHHNMEEAGEFHNALRKYPDSLFADLSNYDTLDSGQMRGAFHEDMKPLMAPEGRLAKQLMYGTDWYMTADGADPYLTNLAKALPRERYPDFYGRNAVHFLGLASGQKARQRLEAFYRRWKMPEPDWIKRVDDGPVTAT